MVLGSMVYDPVDNVWVGNDEDLSAFGRAAPSLITNSDQPKKRNIKVGDMTFDPVEGVWRGNEQDLTKFGPSLISQPKPLSEPIVHGSMLFDPETMTWKGNDEDVDIFDDIEIVDSKKGFKVGDEFTLTQDLIQLFQICEEQHTKLLSGWFSTEYDKTGRNHLSAIRSMSIIKIINQAKTSTVPAKKDDKSPLQNGSPKFTVTKLNKKPVKPQQQDDWDDVTLPSTGKITLKQSRSRSSSISSVDWESNDDSGNANSTLSENSLAKFQDDDDFDDLDINDAKLSKKFASPLKQFTDAEKDNVLDVQQAKYQDSSQEIWEDSDSQDDPPTTGLSKNLQQPVSTYVDDDDWDDVDISALPVRPSTATPLRLKGSATSTPKKAEDSDFSDGLEFSTPAKLTLRPRALSTAERNEEDWSDIEIPSSLVLQPKNPNIIKK